MEGEGLLFHQIPFCFSIEDKMHQHEGMDEGTGFGNGRNLKHIGE